MLGGGDDGDDGDGDHDGDDFYDDDFYDDDDWEDVTRLSFRVDGEGVQGVAMVGAYETGEPLYGLRR